MNQSELTNLLTEAKSAIAAADSIVRLEKVRVEFLGRQGKLTALLRQIVDLSPAEKKTFGQAANQARREVEQWLAAKENQFTNQSVAMVDLDLPGERPERGHLHPLTQFTRRMIEVWRSLGYDVHEGPELEDQWYNFEGLNIPPDHPARDIQDTFYIKNYPNLVLRTHASTVQLRTALHHQSPPLKYVEIGRVYRHEATDAKHEAMFSHCDGIVVDKNLTMAHLVTTLKAFLKQLYPSAQMRVRPSYFPFVEPGIEIDMAWVKNGKTEWLEILGAGMVHPNVLKAMKLPPGKWTGFAFGMGVERLAMLQYGIPDIRLFFNGNIDFLKHF